MSYQRKELHPTALPLEENIRTFSESEIIRLLERIDLKRVSKESNWSIPFETLPADLQDERVDLRDQAYIFVEIINFFISSLQFVTHHRDMRKLREAAFSLIKHYEEVTAQRIKTDRNQEWILLTQEFLRVAHTLYRVFADQTLNELLLYHADQIDGRRNTAADVLHAAQRSLALYDKLPIPTGKSFTQVLMELSSEHQAVLIRLNAAGFTFPDYVSQSNFALMKAWMRAASTLFLCKTKTIDRIKGSKPNPIVHLSEIANEFFPEPRIDTPFEEPEFIQRLQRYRAFPRLTDPVEQLARAHGQTDELKFSDLFSVINSVYHHYIATYNKDVVRMFDGRETRKGRRAYLANTSSQFLEILAFCNYSVLAREFSFEHMEFLVLSIKMAAELQLLTGHDMSRVLVLRKTIDAIFEELLKGTDGYTPQLLENLLLDKEHLENEQTRFGNVVRMLSEIEQMLRKIKAKEISQSSL